MITIAILIGICVFLYRNFAEAAHEYDKPRAGFGMLGVGIFFVSYLLISFVIVLLITANGIGMDLIAALLLEIGIMAAAAGVAFIFRSVLKKAWAKQRLLQKDSSLLDDLN